MAQFRAPMGIGFDEPWQYLNAAMVDEAAATALTIAGDPARRILGTKAENWNARLLDVKTKAQFRRFMSDFLNPVDVELPDGVEEYCPMPYIVLDGPAIRNNFKAVGQSLQAVDQLTVPDGCSAYNPWYDWTPARMPVLLISTGDDSQVVAWRAGDKRLASVGALTADIDNRMAADHKCAVCQQPAARLDFVPDASFPGGLGNPCGPNSANDIYLEGCGHHVCSKCLPTLTRMEQGGKSGKACPVCQTFTFI